MQRFLTAGGEVRATIGLDFGNTSDEGLRALLALESDGHHIATHVFHDEHPGSTFHPKVYLFSAGDRCQLWVGSNNATAAGLGTNVEAVLGLEGAPGDDPIRQAIEAMRGWRADGADARSRRLTPALLDQLVEHGYVRTEKQIRSGNAKSAKTRRPGFSPLFGRSLPRALASSNEADCPNVSLVSRDAISDVLLMRIRPRRNGNQCQISMRIMASPFMKGVERVVLMDGSRRDVGDNSARGKKNTVRFETPGMKEMVNPVARFRWVTVVGERKDGKKLMQFELFDAASNDEGRRILNLLEGGIGDNPDVNLANLRKESTVLSKADRETAQWYRLALMRDEQMTV